MAESTIEGAREIIALFTSLSSRQMRGVHASALRNSLEITKREAIRNIRASDLTKRSKARYKYYKSKNRSQGGLPAIAKGIKISVSRDAGEAKLHIMGHPLLRIFERGSFKTAGRYTKKGVRRGDLPGYFFFADAVQTTHADVISGLEGEIVRRINMQWSSYW
jgi:hypothetical protein